MQQPSDAREPRLDAKPARGAWTRPELVEYGHLAKLTRGGSGIMTESGMGKTGTCL